MSQIKNIFVDINGRLININDLPKPLYGEFQKEASIMQSARIEREWQESIKNREKVKK